jgi:hypothetical protein
VESLHTEEELYKAESERPIGDDEEPFNVDIPLPPSTKVLSLSLSLSPMFHFEMMRLTSNCPDEMMQALTRLSRSRSMYLCTYNAAQPSFVPLRKPKYFNRVIMGIDWNKYNQTHYDEDNPPPKVVFGYRFNIFYPDLIDKVPPRIWIRF